MEMEQKQGKNVAVNNRWQKPDDRLTPCDASRLAVVHRFLKTMSNSVEEEKATHFARDINISDYLDAYLAP